MVFNFFHVIDIARIKNPSMSKIHFFSNHQLSQLMIVPLQYMYDRKYVYRKESKRLNSELSLMPEFFCRSNFHVRKPPFLRWHYYMNLRTFKSMQT